MIIIENFNTFHAKKFRKNKSISYIQEPVEIRLDIEAVPHAMDRQYRHGVDQKIEDADVIELVERSIEELTIALMQDRLNVGERFTIKDKETGLNVIAVIEPEVNNFKLIVITIMVKDDFKTPSDQFVLTI